MVSRQRREKGSIRSRRRFRGVLMVEAEGWRQKRGKKKSLDVLPILFSLIKLLAYFTCFSLTTVNQLFFMNLNWFRSHVQNS
jgi:hypothetical protein